MNSKTRVRNNFFHLLKITAVFFVTLTAVILFTKSLQAQGINVDEVARGSGLGTASLQTIIGNIIKWILAMLGVALLVIVIVAGFKWMTSAGDQAKIDSAKKMLKAAVIGMAIILASYTIVSLLTKSFKLITSLDNPGTPGNEQSYEFSGFGAGALGGGVIENHFPSRDAINVPRNTMIMISYKIPVATSSIVSTTPLQSGSSEESICNGYTKLNNIPNGNACGLLSEQIKIYKVKDSVDTLIDNTKFIAVLLADGKNVVIKPKDPLGSATDNTFIKIHLTQSMLATDGKVLFNGLSSGYSWRFEVSTFLDVTPPTVDVFPASGSTGIYRNVIMQMNFSEPINILNVNTSTIVINNNSISGVLKISNQFKSVEFLSSEPCAGTGEPILNSCGEPVFCLPANTTINTVIKSLVSPGSLIGISDASGNALDGDENGEPGGDYDDWSFQTTGELDLTPPVVTAIKPDIASSNNSVNPDIRAIFNEEISPSSLNSESFYIYKNIPTCSTTKNGIEGKKSSIQSTNQNRQVSYECFPSYSVYLATPTTTNIGIGSPYLDVGSANYRPRLTYNIRDAYGNCFYDALGPSASNPTTRSRGQQ